MEQEIQQLRVEFAKYMLSKGTVTKQELMEKFRISSERKVRRVIEEMSYRVPILATSDKKGYKIATRYEDLNEVEHTWREIDCRIKKLEQRKVKLMEFYDKFTKIKIKE